MASTASTYLICQPSMTHCVTKVTPIHFYRWQMSYKENEPDCQPITHCLYHTISLHWLLMPLGMHRHTHKHTYILMAWAKNNIRKPFVFLVKMLLNSHS